MRHAAFGLSLVALAGIIVPPVLFIGDQMPLASVQAWMLAATVVWFASAPVWMDRG